MNLAIIQPYHYKNVALINFILIIHNNYADFVVNKGKDVDHVKNKKIKPQIKHL